MLPLVKDSSRSRRWKPGWCTYTDGFENNPDIEVFCGGENDKTATAAACWRQGNLLHFGFEQSPGELNEAGQRLLLNSIAYISRFTEDRPIAVTPSVFAGPTGLPRTYLDRRIGKNGDLSEVEWIASAGLIGVLRTMTADQIRLWYGNHRAYLHPGADKKLEVDQDALAAGTPIDSLEFFEKAIAALRDGGAAGERGLKLLHRYGPAALAETRSADEWENWFKTNRAFLFFSDQGDYRWYVDPLAKKRGVPSAELRGPARASRQ